MGKFFKSGFTLGETLIALTIVGVISALTVPSVINNYQRKTFALAVKKNYLNIQENLTKLQTENYRNNSIVDTKLTTNIGDFLTENFKINKDCGNSAQPCFATEYDTINGGITNFSCNSGRNVLLANGAAICMIQASAEAPVVTVYIDTNGTNGPNIGGRDMFTFNIYEDFSIDEVSPTEIKNATVNRNTLFDNNCKTSSVGKGCFNKLIIDKWKMNY